MTPKAAINVLAQEIRQQDARKRAALKKVPLATRRELQSIAKALHQFAKQFNALLNKNGLDPRGAIVTLPTGMAAISFEWNDLQLTFEARPDGIYLHVPEKTLRRLPRLRGEKAEAAAVRYTLTAVQPLIRNE